MNSIHRAAKVTAVADPFDVEQEDLALVQEYLALRRDHLIPRMAAAHAWDRFYNRFGPYIVGVVRRTLRGGVITDDCIQDVWRVVIDRLPGFRLDADKGEFRSWLFTVARRATLNVARRAARRTFESQATNLDALEGRGDGDPSAAFDLEASRDAVRAILEWMQGRLTDQTYQVFYLRAVKGRTVRETASALGLKPEQVRARLYQVMKGLRTSCRHLVE